MNNNQNWRSLKVVALLLVAFHFVVVVLHSIAHEVLKVKASPAVVAAIGVHERITKVGWPRRATPTNTHPEL